MMTEYYVVSHTTKLAEFCLFLTTIIQLHISHLPLCFFLDTGDSATEVLQGMFVFPDSRVIRGGDMFLTLLI